MSRRRGGKNRTKPNPYQKDYTLPSGGAYWQSQAYNTHLVTMYRNMIMQMAMNRFRWLNLPPTCDARFLEYTLMMEGCATICYPRRLVGQFYSTRCVFQSPPNVYDDYPKWKSVGNNGWSFYADKTSGTLVWDNSTRFPIMVGIETFANQLANIQLTKEMNRFHQRIPWVLKGPKSRENDMRQIVKQVAGGELAMMAYDGFGDIDVDALQTQVPFIGAELAQDEKNTWNSIYHLLGVENTTLKLERQTEDEIHAQKSPTTLVRMASLSERRKAADYLNEHFGKYLKADISVVWNEDNQSENWNLFHNDKKLMQAMGEM